MRDRRPRKGLTPCERALRRDGYSAREARIILTPNRHHIRWLREAGYTWAQARRARFSSYGTHILVHDGRCTRAYTTLELLSIHCGREKVR